jgi:hypothetical protein
VFSKLKIIAGSVNSQNGGFIMGMPYSIQEAMEFLELSNRYISKWFIQEKE